jgi:zinc transport system substrate-binding protein
MAIAQAEAVKTRLVQLMPEHRQTLEANFATLVKDLEHLDRQFETLIQTKPGLPLLASHPIYHYLQRRYDLNLKSLHWEPDQAPSSEDLEALSRMLTEHPAQWILWEDDPMPETIQKLESLGVHCATFNPCANRPREGDYLDAMRRNAENLKRVYAQ